jgi:hypothetical protein
MNGIRRVVIETIDHNAQAYDTLGDYKLNGDTLTVYTSDIGDWRMSLACAVHEVIEAALMVQDGVPLESSTDFDIGYEGRRQLLLEKPNIPDKIKRGTFRWMGRLVDSFGCSCTPTEDSEPGEDRHAPYRSQHAFADGVERLFADRLGVVWSEYCEKQSEHDWHPNADDRAERN